MTLTIDLPPELEARLIELAAKAGQAPSDYAREALRDSLSTVGGDLLPKRAEDRVAALRSWAESLKPIGHWVDDSRESIYEGCGE